VVFDATDQYLRGVVRSTVVARHARDGEVTGLGATSGEDDAAGFAPTKAATSSRASSTARRASRAARWLPEGLPTTPRCHGAMASATSSRRGAEAA